MDVTAPEREHLQSQLRETIGQEATRTMMAHLPEGGVSRVVTKDDIARLEAKMATKDDLERFATKDDLRAFATKDDLRAFATREEFNDLRSDVRELKTTVSQLGRDVHAALVLGDKLRAEWRQDLVTYVGRQTLIQVGSLLTIIVAAMVFAAQLAS